MIIAKRALGAALDGDNAIPTMSINNYNLGGGSSFGAPESGLVTEPYAPAFTTCGKGDKKSASSTVKLWTCCYCGHSGMAVKSTYACPNCGHAACGYCQQYKVKTSSSN